METLFALYPLGALRFMRKVLFFGLATGLLTQLPFAWLVWLSWQSGEQRFCARVLRAYHLARLALFCAQIPLRILLLRGLSRARSLPRREEVVASLTTLSRSTTWRCNQATGILAYCFFAFALVFAICGRHCGNEPGAALLPRRPSESDVDDAGLGWFGVLSAALARFFSSTQSVVPSLYAGLLINGVVFVTHMSSSFIWLQQILAEDAFEAATWRNGATKNMLERYTRVLTVPPSVVGATAEDEDAFSDAAAAVSSGDSASAPSRSALPPLEIDGVVLPSRDCPICFCAFVHPQQLRVLPCAHTYHLDCIDGWLSAKKQCPLCNQSVDAPVAASHFTEEVLGGASSAASAAAAASKPFSDDSSLRRRSSALVAATTASSAGQPNSVHATPLPAVVEAASPVAAGGGGGALSPEMRAAWTRVMAGIDPAAQQVPAAGDAANDRVVNVVLTGPSTTGSSTGGGEAVHNASSSSSSSASSSPAAAATTSSSVPASLVTSVGAAAEEKKEDLAEDAHSPLSAAAVAAVTPAQLLSVLRSQIAAAELGVPTEIAAATASVPRRQAPAASAAMSQDEAAALAALESAPAPASRSDAGARGIAGTDIAASSPLSLLSGERRVPVKQVPSRPPAAAITAAAAAAKVPAATLLPNATTLPSAAGKAAMASAARAQQARLQATQWREQLDRWAEEEDEDDEPLPLPSRQRAEAQRAGDEDAPSSTAVSTSTGASSMSAEISEPANPSASAASAPDDDEFVAGTSLAAVPSASVSASPAASLRPATRTVAVAATAAAAAAKPPAASAPLDPALERLVAQWAMEEAQLEQGQANGREEDED